MNKMYSHFYILWSTWAMKINNFEPLSIEKDTFLIEIFSKGEGTKHIRVAAWVTFTYLALVKEDVSLDISIESTGEWAHILAKSLCIAKENSDITLKMHGHLKHNHATADLHMISLLQNNSVCEIDWGVDLHAWVHKISGHLLEENIILWENIKIKTLPMLDVHSSDVSASHGARIERLDEKKLFYMKSRWLDSTQAKELILSWYFEQVFAVFKESEIPENKKTIWDLQQERLTYLLN